MDSNNHSRLIDRFQGPDSSVELGEALLKQELVAHDGDVASRLAVSGELVSAVPGDLLFAQGDAGDDVFFLLAGSVEVLVNGHAIAVRGKDRAVGEMAAIEHAATRSASLRVLSEIVALKVTARVFLESLGSSGAAWRRLSESLASKLRERDRFHAATNDPPVMFVGSSVEGLKIAEAIKHGLRHESVSVKLWSYGTFKASQFPIDELLAQVGCADFACFVLSADDLVDSRGGTAPAPRDNVIFEIGLFMGKLGRSRVFLIRKAGSELKVPSDLEGILAIEYHPKPNEAVEDSVATVCFELKNLMRSLGGFRHMRPAR